MRGWMMRLWLAGVSIAIASSSAVSTPQPERQSAETPHTVHQEGMVEVPGGFFLMGANDGFPDERPQQQVYVEQFYIDTYEVTNRQFRAADMQPLHTYGVSYTTPDLPVVGVTWFQARAYCIKHGKRLPSEAEWEKAARGVDGRKFPWGNFWDPTLANDGRGPRVVGSFPLGVSPFGVHDMAGNVWEWAEDRYTGYGTDPTQVRRVLRGGAWNVDAVFMRTTYRRHERPEYTAPRLGFRCAAAP